jgi:hypothetical protein
MHKKPGRPQKALINREDLQQNRKEREGGLILFLKIEVADHTHSINITC